MQPYLGLSHDWPQQQKDSADSKEPPRLGRRGEDGPGNRECHDDASGKYTDHSVLSGGRHRTRTVCRLRI